MATNCNIFVAMIICPKCKADGENILLKEWTEAVVEWQQTNNGGIYSRNGNLDFGLIFQVSAKCLGCQHIWKLKGVTQMTELVDSGRIVDLDGQWG